MDRSWRPRPMQGNICPTCLISHFPFCSPHPQFHQNPRFQSHNDLTFQRPYFDPFLDHRGPTPGLHRPFIGNPNDGFGDPRPWHRNPSLERESFGQFHGQSQIGDPAMASGARPDGFAPHRYEHGGAGFKRMRVDETGIGSFTNDNFTNMSRISVENERRLKLIRDHGGGVNLESKGYDQESSFGRSFGSTDHDELQGSGNDMALKPSINFKLNNFGDQDFDKFGRKEDHGLASAPQYMRSNENEELGQLRFESSLNPSLQIDVRKGLPIGGSPVVKQGGHGEDMDHFYNEGGALYKSNLGDVYSSNVLKSDLNQLTHMSQFRRGSYPTSEVPGDNYYKHNLDFLPPKETQHPHPFSGSSAPYHGQRSNFPMENQNPMQQLKYDFRSSGQLSEMRQSFEVNFPPPDRNQSRIGHNNFSSMSKYGNIMGPEDMGPMEASRVFSGQPPLPASPPPPLPADPRASFSPPRISSSLFPIHLSASATGSSSYPPAPDHSLAHPSSHSKLHLRASAGFATDEESQVIQTISSNKYLGEGRQFPPRHLSSDKPKFVDASHIFNQPHRAQRPDHIVIILRGLPGSGKSYLAKMLRDIEVENGGDAPRIHSMDEYFMTEVEKVEENEVSKSYASGRGKKPVTKKVMEYCYEPEMEEAYRSSMLKAFKKTLEEGVFSFIIVDDRNLRVADFAQFWAIAKRSGYEVYLLEATYKDPAGCAARNVHGFTQDDIERMARQWEEAPSLYLKLDIKSLFHGDDLKESGIQEVDMDTEDGGSDGGLSGFEGRIPDKTMVPLRGDSASDGSLKNEKGRNAEIDHPIDVKELGSSKWSADFDDDKEQRTEASKGNLSSLSGLIQAYGKEGKSVHWGDQIGNTGFSIGAAQKASTLSLVIGPGNGYNLKSNPLSEEVNQTTLNSVESKGQSKFQERLRAERESFKAVFDKRRQRIIGFDLEDE